MPTKTYKQKDLEKLDILKTVAEAAGLWAFLCAKEVAENGDRGSCVLGAGIGVWMVPTGCRKGVEFKLLDVPYTASQGSFTWETSTGRVLKFLAEKGVDAHYINGHLD